MTVYLPCYCTREEAQRALDISPGAYDYARIDRAIEAARDDIEGLCHRRFYNIIETCYFDWPNFQRAYPWRIWLDAAELADVTVNVPVVTTGGTVIPGDQIFWRSWNYSPPYYAIELDRSTNAAFGVGVTPQRDVSITGTFGYWAAADPGGTLAAAMGDTTTGTATVSNSAFPGVGDVITVDSESMLVQDRNWYATGDSQSGSGATTASSADNLLAVSGGTFYAGEALLLDAEQMLVLSVNGSSLTVRRAFNGTVLSAHSGAAIYAGRLLSVTRGDLGTAAATHLNSAPVSVSRVPAQVKTLAVAEAVNTLLQESSGYARVVGEAGEQAAGGSLPDLRASVYTRYGRKNRKRVI